MAVFSTANVRASIVVLNDNSDNTFLSLSIGYKN